MRKRHLCTIFKLYTNSFYRQKAGLEVFIRVTAVPIFLPFYLSLTSELWLRRWVYHTQALAQTLGVIQLLSVPRVSS